MPIKNVGSYQVYQKAESLYEITSHLVSYVSLNKDVVKLYKSNSLRDIIANALLTDTRLISKNIVQALSSESHNQTIKNASSVGIMIRNINSYCIGLEKDGVKEKEYLNLLQTEIESFKKAYKKWVKSLPNSSSNFL